MEIYKGIPFAAPPIGSLRFMPPVTVTPWREIRSATHFGPVCPQILPDTRNETAALSMMSQGRLEAIRDMKPKLANQTEDCLYLNVYSPKSKSGRMAKTNLIYFSFTTLQTYETFYIHGVPASFGFFAYPKLVWTHCSICSMYMYYCKTLQETTTPVALGKSLVGEKIITIKCRTLESSKKSTKGKENEAAKNQV